MKDTKLVTRREAAAGVAALLLGGAGCKREPAPVAEKARVERKLYVVNSAGSSVSIIDVATRQLVGEIAVGARPHGLAVLPDQSRLFVSSERTGRISIIDTRSDQVVGAMRTSGKPNQMAITSDARWLYCAIRDKGVADVFDLATKKLVKSVDVGKDPHNCYCPVGSRLVYVTAIVDRLVRVFDCANDHASVQTISFSGEVRPITVTRDGRRLFAALSNLHGFAWVDLDTNTEPERVGRPPPSAAQASKYAYLPTHGLELRPGDRELWVTSFMGRELMVFDVMGKSPRHVNNVTVGDAPNWIAFSPDGRFVYAANAGASTVSIVDCDARRSVAEVAVGKEPKRLLEVHPPMS